MSIIKLSELKSGSAITSLNADRLSGTIDAARLPTVSGLSAGTYGSSTSIPVVQVDNKGRVTSISTAAGDSTSVVVSGANAMTGALVFNRQTTAVPAVGANGGTGDRFVLWPGSSTAHPYAIGINSYTLWYSVPDTAMHAWYTNGGEKMRLTSTGNLGVANTAPAYKLDVAGNARFNNVLVGDCGHGTSWAGFAHQSAFTTASYALLQNNVGETLINSANGQRIGFRHNNTEYMSLTGGSLGVGTSSPAYKLHVAGDIRADAWLRSAGHTGWYNDTYGGGWYMVDGIYVRIYSQKILYCNGNWTSGSEVRGWVNAGGIATGQYSTSFAFSALFENNIWVSSSCMFSSDKRIKRNIRDVDPDANLERFQRIKPVTYDYIDGRSKNQQYGCIADDIMEVFPEVVSVDTQYIPDVMSPVAHVSGKLDGGEVIVAIEQPSSVYQESPKLLAAGDILRIFCGNRQVDSVRVVWISPDEGRACRICLYLQPEPSPSPKPSEPSEAADIFIYGRQVSDFKSVDYNKLFMSNIAATQALCKKLKAAEARVSSMEAKLLAQDARIARLEALYNI